MAKKAISDTTYDRIQAWCLDPDSANLSEKDKEIFDRWDSADNFMRRYPNKKHAAGMMQKKYPTLSRSQIYIDLDNAQRLFGSMTRVDKDYYREWLVDEIIKHIKRAKKMLEDSTIEKKFPALKSITDSHANLIRALRLDKEDKEQIDPALFEQNTFYAIINIGGQSYKADMDEILQLQPSSLKHIMEAFNKPIDIEDAKVIMES